MVGPGKARACVIQVPWDKRINHRIFWIGTFQSKCLATCFFSSSWNTICVLGTRVLFPRRVLCDWVEA